MILGRSRFAATLLALVGLAACGPGPTKTGALEPQAPPRIAAPPSTILATSTPAETTLREQDVPDAADVWIAMIKGAQRSIDLAEFYISDAPGSRLHAVLEEVERAAARGVQVRLLVDETFHAKYPEVPDAWAHIPHVEVRRLDLRPGVLHAKYFVVDGRVAYLGSQNFDYRSLEHIFEVGVRTEEASIVSGLGQTFAADWARAPLRLGAFRDAELTLGVSPQPDDGPGFWELPRLVAWIGEAKRRLRVEVLTYKTKDRAGAPFLELDQALRAAAGRGVHVSLLVSTWGERDDAVASLAHVPNVEVRVLAIPDHSSGPIPFARVAHAKYAIFDDDRAWIGTSNWEGDYFYKSRNVSLFARGGTLPAKTARLFDDALASRYARPLAGAAP